jgi:site-specific DNA-cytosine methylase
VPMVGISVEEVKTLWFTKSRRAQNVDDYETWVEGGVMPTLNSFDNGDVRTTIIIFYGNRVDDVRIQGGVINTLQARMGTGGNNMPMVATTDVRRLTPVECERLQGFPDDWTEGQSDSHRYKQMGNAVAVPVVEWIIQGISDTL